LRLAEGERKAQTYDKYCYQQLLGVIMRGGSSEVNAMRQSAMCRAIALLVLWLPALSVAQDGALRLKETPLEVVSTVRVASTVGLAMTTPIVCGSDKTIFLRLGAPRTVQTIPPDLFSISSDGKNVVRFNADKIHDVPNAVTEDFFASDDRVYLLVYSDLKVQKRTAIIQKPDGTTKQMPVSVASERNFYIATFERNGAYLRTARLDLPFVPQQFGVFASGDYLVAGRTKQAPTEPRVALVRWNGQFDRYLELENDVSADSLEFKNRREGGAPHTGSFFFAMNNSRIVADGRDLVLFRPGTQAPVFAVSSGGAVRAIRLKVADKLVLFNIRPTGRRWIAVYAEGDVRFVTRFITYSINPDSGLPTEAYTYPNAFGLVLACTDGSDFNFVKVPAAGEGDTSLTIINAAPARTPGM